MRGNGLDGLVVAEVILELGAFLLLALFHLRLEPGVAPQPLAKLPHEHRVLGPFLHENLACTVQGCLFVGHTPGGVHVTGSHNRGNLRRICQQGVRERLEPGFARDLRPGSALGFVRQVEIFESGFCLSSQNACLEFWTELALLLDALQHRSPTRLQLPEVSESFLQQAQLPVVEATGRFFPVPGNKRHSGSAVEQIRSRGHLSGPDTQSLGNTFGDWGKHAALLCLQLHGRRNLLHQRAAVSHSLHRSHASSDWQRRAMALTRSRKAYIPTRRFGLRCSSSPSLAMYSLGSVASTSSGGLP